MAKEYTVVWSENALVAVKDIGQKAIRAGRAKEFAAVLRKLHDRLRTEPELLGEVYSVQEPIEQHLAVQDFVGLNFAIDKARNLVLVKSTALLSGPWV